MRLLRTWSTILGLILVSCAAPEGLTVDVKTDYAAGEQFASVRTELSTTRFPDALVTGTVVTVPSSAGEPYLAGVRVAEHRGLGTGTYFVRVSLVTAGGAVLASRTTEVQVQGRYALTTILSRSCEGVVCPVPGDALRTECNGGVCVDPTCSPETPEACAAGCTSTSDCASDPRAMTECGSASCVDGVCLFAPSDARCAGGARCRGADLTCAETPDAGPVDAATFDGAAPDVGAPDATPFDTGALDSGALDVGTEPPDAAAAPDAACRAGFAECDGNPATICETNLTTSPAHCGGCGLTPPEVCDGRDNTCEGTIDEGCRIPVHRAVRASPYIAYRYTTDVAQLSTDGYTPERMNVYYVYPAGAGAGSDGLYHCQWTTGGTLTTRSPTCEDHPETGSITQLGRVFNPAFLGDPASDGCANTVAWWHINPTAAPSFYQSLSAADPPTTGTDWMSDGHTFCVWTDAGP